MANNKYSLGIDIGGTNTVFGLVDKKGKVIIPWGFIKLFGDYE